MTAELLRLAKTTEHNNYDREYVLWTVEDVIESVGIMCALTNTDIDELVWRNLENVTKTDTERQTDRRRERGGRLRERHTENDKEGETEKEGGEKERDTERDNEKVGETELE